MNRACNHAMAKSMQPQNMDAGGGPETGLPHGMAYIMFCVYWVSGPKLEMTYLCFVRCDSRVFPWPLWTADRTVIIL